MRTKAEFIKEINGCQQLLDRTTMSIGHLYSQYTTKQDKHLMTAINEKIEVLKKLEMLSRDLEIELSKTKD